MWTLLFIVLLRYLLPIAVLAFMLFFLSSMIGRLSWNLGLIISDRILLRLFRAKGDAS